MPRFHHVNLATLPDEIDAEMVFLTDVLGYRRMELNERLGGLGARWFEADDGSQVHLSLDPEHRPAARAHVAIEFGAALADVEDRLRARAVEFDVGGLAGFPRVVTCRDPGGNLWELRGEMETAEA
jgi:catechol 2,3-dioxygenase-like lactoylglutathione lyase family enzyme